MFDVFTKMHVNFTEMFVNYYGMFDGCFWLLDNCYQMLGKGEPCPYRFEKNWKGYDAPDKNRDLYSYKDRKMVKFRLAE